MKKYLLIALASLFAFSSCSKESNEAPEVNTDKTVTLTFTSKRPQLKSDTKTAWDATSSSIVWSATDKIKVGFTYNGSWWAQTAAYSSENASPNNHIKFYQSSEVTIDETNSSIGTFTVPSTFKNEGATSGSYKFYAVYPADLIDNSLDSAPSATVTLKTSQTPGIGTFDRTTDIMVGASNAIISTGLPSDPIELNWKRVVAHADLSFSQMNFNGTEIPQKITLTFNEEAKVAGSFSVNISDGTIGTGSANEIVLEGTGLVVDGSSIKVWACVLPVTFTSLDVEIKTDKATYTRSIDSINKTFKQNSRNKLTVNMSTADRAAATQYDWVKKDLSTITSSDVFVIVGNNGANYAMSNDKGTTNPPLAVAVTVANDKLSSSPVESIQWTLSGNSTDGYTFYPNGTSEKWLYVYDNNNGLRVGTSADKVFKIQDDYLFNTGKSRYIGVYNSADWRSYGTINNNIKDQTFAFYVKTAKDTRAEAGLSYAQSEYSANLGESFTAPTLTNPNNLTVSYSSSNESVATVNASTGAVTLVAAGSTVITASFAGDATYQPGTASYTLTVTDPNTNDGSLEHPYTASEAAALASAGNTGSYYISGIVTKVQFQYDESHGTAAFWIDENGSLDNLFEGYHIKYFGNVNWVEGNAEIAVDDEVIIYGTLTLYNTTPETSSGYLVSLNGKTKGLTPGTLTATPDNANKQITVTWDAATGTSSAISYVVSCGTQTYNATAAGSHTFTMTNFGIYDITVTASASDAISATATTTATLTDPSSSSPDPETITFSTLGLTNEHQYLDPFDGGNFTITFAGGDNDGKYYNTGSGIRTYGNGTITISSSYDIKEIAFTWSGSYAPSADNADPTGYSTDTKKWTGNAKTVTLTRPTGSGHWRLQAVTVVYK